MLAGDDRRAIDPQLWVDADGNWFTGADGTVPISEAEARRLAERAEHAALAEGRWLLYGIAGALIWIGSLWLASAQ